MSGHIVTRYDSTPAKCYPDKPRDDCQRCTRFATGKRSNKVVSIDASTFRCGGECPMFIWRTH